MNPADGLYVPLADTLAVPTVVPPLVQSLGGEDCGPNTSKVIVPPGEEPPDNTPETDDAEIALPAVPDDGALTDTDGDAVLIWISLTVPPS